MALEIKGLKARMLEVTATIERVNRRAAMFAEVGAGLERGLSDITAQVLEAESDLNFAASVLGNSTSETSGDNDTQLPKGSEAG